MPKVHEFPNIPELTLETELYTQRLSSSDEPKNYKFTVGELLGLISSIIQPPSAPIRIEIEEVVGNTFQVPLPPGVRLDILEKVLVFREGVGLMIWGKGITLSGTNTIQLNWEAEKEAFTILIYK